MNDMEYISNCKCVYLYRFEAESTETVGLKYSQVSKFVVLK